MNDLPKNSYGVPKRPPLPEPAPIVQIYLNKLRQYPATPMAGRTAIDLGCGRGRNSLALAKRQFKVIGIDSNPEDLRIAEERRAGQRLGEYSCRFVEADIRALPEFDEPFDTPFNVVAINEVLHNLPKSDQYDLLSDMRRRTRHGGVHLVSGYMISLEARDKDNEVQAQMLNPGELKRVYEGAGWTIINYWDEESQVQTFNDMQLVSSRAHIMAMAR